MSDSMLRFLLMCLGLMILASPSAAVDTWEPYPLGPSTLEFYATRYGQGADSDSLRGYAISGGPIWGLSPRAHVYLFLGISSNDVHLGALDFVSFGLFSSLYESSLFDLDAYAQIDAVGPGLTASSRLAGLEYNVDLKRWGFFARSSWTWENDGANERGAAVIGRRAQFTFGSYFSLSSRVQILAELQQEALSDFVSIENESRMTSWALGYNRQLTEVLELIFEARAHEPLDDGERIWDFTLGVVTVW